MSLIKTTSKHIIPINYFTIKGDECSVAQCAEHGAGAGAGVSASGECACACPQRAPLFREDRELCVDDLPGNYPPVTSNVFFYSVLNDS